jgi:hypothetical protein
MSLHAIIQIEPNLLLRIAQYLDQAARGRLVATCQLTAGLLRGLPVVTQTIVQAARLIGYRLSVGLSVIGPDYSPACVQIIEKSTYSNVKHAYPNVKYTCVTVHVIAPECNFWCGGLITEGSDTGALTWSLVSVYPDGTMDKGKSAPFRSNIHRTFVKATRGDHIIWGGCPCEDCRGPGPVSGAPAKG